MGKELILTLFLLFTRIFERFFLVYKNILRKMIPVGQEGILPRLTEIPAVL